MSRGAINRYLPRNSLSYKPKTVAAANSPAGSGGRFGLDAARRCPEKSEAGPRRSRDLFRKTPLLPVDLVEPFVRILTEPSFGPAKALANVPEELDIHRCAIPILQQLVKLMLDWCEVWRVGTALSPRRSDLFYGGLFATGRYHAFSRRCRRGFVFSIDPCGDDLELTIATEAGNLPQPRPGGSREKVFTEGGNAKGSLRRAGARAEEQ
jgi:hypothetical protein